MKVVLFCGGLGTRLREYSQTVPKPLVNIGSRPIIWQLMKYYAHHGHTDFILCLGYRGDLIKEYFLNYDECMSNDFTLSKGGHEIKLNNSDIDDWTISFVDTGLNSNIGERLKAIEPYVKDEEVFLANYSDGLSDYPINQSIDDFRETNAVVSFASVRPPQSFHGVNINDEGFVTHIEHVADSETWINGGFFVLNNKIFNYMKEGEELVEEPFTRLIQEKKLMAKKYKGFWSSMDTFKDKTNFDNMYASGDMPWQVWKK